METQHTQGTWFAYADCVLTDEGKIAEVCTQNNLCKNNWKANAKLIAAAPELLKACNFALQGINHGQIDQLTIDILTEAIQKATE